LGNKIIWVTGFLAIISVEIQHYYRHAEGFGLGT